MAARKPVDYSVVSKYVGIPYEKTNCLQLVRQFYMRELHIEVKQYYEGSTPTPEVAEGLISSNKGEFTRVEGEPEFGDIVLIRLMGMECHMGIFIQKGTFLHALKGVGSAVERVEKYKHRIVGFYRHRGFTP